MKSQLFRICLISLVGFGLSACSTKPSKLAVSTLVMPMKTAMHCQAKDGQWDCQKPVQATRILPQVVAVKATVQPVAHKKAPTKVKLTQVADPFNCSKASGKWSCSLGQATSKAQIKVAPVSVPVAVKKKTPIKAKPVYAAGSSVKSGDFSCKIIHGVWKCALKA